MRKISLKSISTKIAILVAILTFAFVAPIQSVTPAYADKYDDQIRAYEQDIAKYQAEAAKLSSQAATLQSALAELANQKAAIQAQIDLNQAKHDKLVSQIKETEIQIQNSRDALGVTIADLYVDSGITPLEMLASSKNISEYLDQQEYRNSIRDNLVASINEIKELKAKLDKQKADVSKVLAEKKKAKDALAAKQKEQQYLLNQTKGEEANYQDLIGDRRAQIDQAKATQAALRAKINGSGGYVLIEAGSLGAYPWNYSNCPMLGPWSTGGSNGNGGDGHGYGCRQCTSYVAWRIANEIGIYYENWGNGSDFVASARSNGYQTGSTPRANSVASIWGNPGHVAWIESDPYVNGNGQMVMIVSQYNYDYGQGYGMYSKMEMSVNAFDEYAYMK